MSGAGPKIPAFPQTQANSPSRAESALESDYDTLQAVQYDEGLQQAQQNPGLLGMMGLGQLGQAFNQATALLDPKERTVGEELGKKGYTIVRQKFKDSLPPGAVGKGSFGMVYKATRTSGNKTVMCGIKMIENGKSVGHLTSKEIDTLGMCRHPAMINFVESFVVKEKDWIFIVQEFAAGGDLNQALCNQPEAFDEAMVRVMTYHICCAMGYAHQKGIMHRDLKPENVLLTELGFPKVCDFGLSRRLNDCDLAKTKAGTPVYMAPEVMKGQLYDFSVDVFSVGLIVADMMAEKTVMAWFIDRIPANMRPPPKKWPNGKSDKQFSKQLRDLQVRMAHPQHGKRPSFYKVINELEALAVRDKKPHPFWGAPLVNEIIKPSGPPGRGPKLSNLFSLSEGDDIAKKNGFTVGADCKIKILNEWRDAKVEHVSKAIIPGAVHVRYTDKEGLEKVRVVDPAQFGKVLWCKGYKGKACCTVQ